MKKNQENPSYLFTSLLICLVDLGCLGLRNRFSLARYKIILEGGVFSSILTLLDKLMVCFFAT